MITPRHYPGVGTVLEVGRYPWLRAFGNPRAIQCWARELADSLDNYEHSAEWESTLHGQPIRGLSGIDIVVRKWRPVDVADVVPCGHEPLCEGWNKRVQIRIGRS